jgi:hypothetical protein
MNYDELLYLSPLSTVIDCRLVLPWCGVGTRGLKFI